ncbi:MAG TPA: hypothetical protein VMW41_03850 [Candidatus Bathyarchaeia archaeon]|nr:hypothetical protein [Candidatus Bathyarchaeia archaeon]
MEPQIKVESVIEDYQEKSSAIKTSNPAIEQKKGSSFDNFWYLFFLVGLISLIITLFLWSSNQKLRHKTSQDFYRPVPPVNTPTPTIIQVNDQQQPEAESDEISVIENDLKETDLSQLDLESEEISQELKLP